MANVPVRGHAGFQLVTAISKDKVVSGDLVEGTPPITGDPDDGGTTFHFFPVEDCDLSDDIAYDIDDGKQGQPGKIKNAYQAGKNGKFSIGGMHYMKHVPVLAKSHMGGEVYTASGDTDTTLSSDADAGDYSISVAAAVPLGSIITIATPTEIRAVIAVDGTTLYLNRALSSNHSSGAAVTTGEVHELYGIAGQPESYSFYRYDGVNTRVFPGGKVSKLSISASDPGKKVSRFKAEGMGWGSTVVGSGGFTPTLDSTDPPAGWQWTVAMGDFTSSTSRILNVASVELEFERDQEAEFALNDTQNPYTVWDGEMSLKAKIDFFRKDDNQLLHFLKNEHPPIAFSMYQANGHGMVVFMSKPLFQSQPKFDYGTIQKISLEAEGMVNDTDKGSPGGSPAMHCKIVYTNNFAAAY